MRLRDSIIGFAASPGSTAIVLAVLSGAAGLIAWRAGATPLAVDCLKGAVVGVAAAYFTRRLDAFLERTRAR